MGRKWVRLGTVDGTGFSHYIRVYKKSIYLMYIISLACARHNTMAPGLCTKLEYFGGYSDLLI